MGDNFQPLPPPECKPIHDLHVFLFTFHKHPQINLWIFLRSKVQ